MSQLLPYVDVVIMGALIVGGGAWFAILRARFKRQLREAAATVGSELGVRVRVEGRSARFELVEGDACLEGKLHRTSQDPPRSCQLQLMIRVTAGLDAAAIDLDRIRTTLSRCSGFSVGGGGVATTVHYPFQLVDVSGHVEDLIYLARASLVLDGQALYELDPRTPEFTRRALGPADTSRGE